MFTMASACATYFYMTLKQWDQLQYVEWFEDKRKDTVRCRAGNRRVEDTEEREVET